MGHSSIFEYLEEFVFRAPTFPMNADIKQVHAGKVFQEALFLASPDLYEFLAECGDSMPEKTQLTLLKYFLRMSHRCTPFGIFAGCGVGRMGEKSEIVINGIQDFRSSTRLDMMYLCALSEELCSAGVIREDLKWRPNNSLYEAGNAYRYVEYKYINGDRKYFLSEIDRDPAIESILHESHKGAGISSMSAMLTDMGFETEEAEQYIGELIENQVLMNDLSPSVTGNTDMLWKIIQQLKAGAASQDNITGLLSNIKELLNTIDQLPPGRDISIYKDIEALVQSTGVTYKRKFLYQSDLAIRSSGTIHKDIFETAMEGFKILNRITERFEHADLQRFKTDFFNRYENESIPLSEALDPDIGIGFGKFKAGNVSINNFVRGLEMINHNPESGNQGGSGFFQEFLLKKYHTFLENGDAGIEIKEQEIKDFPAGETDLPDTLSALIKVIHAGNNSDPLIIMSAATGASAANLLGRFCHTHQGINEIVNKIIQREDSLLDKDHIIAEIVHLPESRIGNILLRPAFRNFEIPYLSGHSVDDKHQLPLSDLMITVRNNRIILRSARLKKVVLPRMTTAHNYSSDTLPVYNFLCALHQDQRRHAVFFNWGKTLQHNKFLPRVTFKNIILSPARWNFTPDETKSLYDPGNTPEHLNAWRSQYNVPGTALIVEADNKLLIDFEDELCAKLFLSEVKGRSFILQEYLCDKKDPLIKNGNDIYANEVIVIFTKRQPV